MPDIDATVNKRSPPSGRMSDNVRSATRPSSPCAPLAPRAPRCRRERVDPVFTRAGADEIQQALELLGRSHNVIYMTFVAKGQTRPRPSEAANVAFAILRGPDTQMIRFGGARIERGSPPDGDRSLKRPIKPPKNLSDKPFLSTSHAPPRRWSADRAAKRSNRRAYHLRNQARDYKLSHPPPSCCTEKIKSALGHHRRPVPIRS